MQLSCIGALLVAVLVVAIGNLSAGDLRPARGLSAQSGTTHASVLWLEEPASLLGDHPRPRHDARAGSAPDAPERSLMVPALVLIAALSLRALRRAGWGRPGVDRPGPPGTGLRVLRPG